MDDVSPRPPGPNVGANRGADEIDKEIQRLQALKARYENQQPTPTVVRGMVFGIYSIQFNHAKHHSTPNRLQIHQIYQDPTRSTMMVPLGSTTTLQLCRYFCFL